MDKFERLISEAEYALVLLANAGTGDFELIKPESLPGSTRTFGERGLSFAGVCGLVAGQPHVALAVELDPDTARRIAEAFIVRVTYVIEKGLVILKRTAAMPRAKSNKHKKGN